MKPETNADGLEHRLATERHRQIDHDSRLKANNRRFLTVAGGQDDGRVGKALMEPGSESELALFGYLKVTEDYICRARHHFVKCRLGIGRLRGPVTITTDPGGQEFSYLRLVVDDQHQGHLASRFSWAPSETTMGHGADENWTMRQLQSKGFSWGFGWLAARARFPSCPTHADSADTGNTGPTWLYRPGRQRASGTLGTRR